MKIRDFICKAEHAAFSDRLENLKRIGAPEVVITAQEKACKELAEGKIKVGGRRRQVLRRPVKSRPVIGRDAVAGLLLSCVDSK